MPEVVVKKGEPVDRALKRLKNTLESEGILDEVRRLRAFETKTEKAIRKHRAATSKRTRNRYRFNYNDFKKIRNEDGTDPGSPTQIAKAEAAAAAAEKAGETEPAEA